MIAFELLDGQPELRLVEFLLPSKVPPSRTLEELHVLLIRHFGEFSGELEVVVEVGYQWGSERVKLLVVEVAKRQFRVLILGDVGRHRLRVLLLHPLDLAHCKVPPLFGEDKHPLALTKSNSHLLSSLNGVSHLGGHEGSLFGFLSGMHSEMTGVAFLLLRLLGGWLDLGGLALLLLLLH